MVQSNSIGYEEIVLMIHQERMDFYQRISNGVQVTSVPQIFIDEKHVGYTDLIRQEDLILKKSSVGLRYHPQPTSPSVIHSAFEMAQNHEKIHWIPEEVSLEDDVHDWKSGKLSQGEKDFVRSVLTLFVQSDVNVGENYINYYLKISRIMKFVRCWQALLPVNLFIRKPMHCSMIQLDFLKVNIQHS